MRSMVPLSSVASLLATTSFSDWNSRSSASRDVCICRGAHTQHPRKGTVRHTQTHGES